MKKRIAVTYLPFFEDHGIHKLGNLLHDFLVTQVEDLNSKLDLNKLWGAKLPNKISGDYPIISWLLDIKNQFTAELAVKGSFLLHSTNQVSDHPPSDFDAVLVIKMDSPNRETIKKKIFSRTLQSFRYQMKTDEDFSNLFYMKIIPNDYGF